MPRFKDTTKQKEFIDRLRKSHLGYKMTQTQKDKIRLAHKGKPKSEAHRKALSGKNNHNWKGGISRNHYSIKTPECKEWRTRVFLRDNWTCQTCGVRGTELNAHHIKSWAKYPELRFDINNGVTLCVECHKLTDNFAGKSNKNI
jgi:hypothetical protein